MKYLSVEVLWKKLKYSPNGWDNALAEKGEEIELPESIVKGLMALKPPAVAIVDESAPKVFHKDEDIVEDVVVDEVELEEEAILEAQIEEQLATEELVSLDELEKAVEDAEDGADVIELGLFYKAVQKSGKWYNIFKDEEKMNDKGVARDKVAKFVYDLYLEEV